MSPSVDQMATKRPDGHYVYALHGFDTEGRRKWPGTWFQSLGLEWMRAHGIVGVTEFRRMTDEDWREATQALIDEDAEWRPRWFNRQLEML